MPQVVRILMEDTGKIEPYEITEVEVVRNRPGFPKVHRPLIEIPGYRISSVNPPRSDYDFMAVRIPF